MRHRTAFLSLLFLFAALSVCFASPSISYQRAKIGRVWMNIVTADLNASSLRVTPAVAKRGIGTSESFRSMIRRMRPIAAIDGTFFCTRTLKPTGDIVIDGRLIYRGCLGTAVAFGDNNSVKFIDCQDYHWNEYRSVLVAGPTLLISGKLAVYPKDQGFRGGVHFTRRIRAAIGVTKNNKLVLVTTLRSVYLSQLARAMRTIGCIDAAGLDGGSSTGLYWNGRVISNPSRGMTNCLLIYDDPTSFDKHRACLFPAENYMKCPTAGS